MTDPLRRDPREFLRVLKMMARQSSWQKCLIFADRGRAIGFPLGLEHYNTVLFSQALWGRALEITKVVRSMQQEKVKPNGVSYHYICSGMANVDHGWNYDFQVNHKLPGLQHWRVALNALVACEQNGYDASDVMYNSVAVACTVPGTNQWQTALKLVEKMADDERKLHPQCVKFLTQCLIRSERPRECHAVLALAAETKVTGFEDFTEPDIFQHLPAYHRDPNPPPIPEIERENAVLEPNSANQPFDSQGVFRPRVYRQLWYKWHAIANRYRPAETMKRRQLAPKSSPSGISGFSRL